MPKEIIMVIVEYALRMIIMAIGFYTLRFIKQYNLEKWVEFSVRAAEQLADVGIIDLGERKEYVKQQILNKFKISEEELDVLIEASVQELNILKNMDMTVNVSNHTPLH